MKNKKRICLFFLEDGTHHIGKIHELFDGQLLRSPIEKEAGQSARDAHPAKAG
jgi:hypothetical protein